MHRCVCPRAHNTCQFSCAVMCARKTRMTKVTCIRTRAKAHAHTRPPVRMCTHVSAQTRVRLPACTRLNARNAGTLHTYTQLHGHARACGRTHVRERPPLTHALARAAHAQRHICAHKGMRDSTSVGAQACVYVHLMPLHAFSHVYNPRERAELCSSTEGFR